MRKAQNGDKDAFLRLMDSCQLSMYRTAKAILHNETDVEDAIQEAVYQGLVPLEVIPEEGREDDNDTPMDVRAALASLAENDRLILTLFYLNDLPVKEIAKLLSITEGAAKMRLSHGRKKFREAYLAGERKGGSSV